MSDSKFSSGPAFLSILKFAYFWHFYIGKKKSLTLGSEIMCHVTLNSHLTLGKKPFKDKLQPSSSMAVPAASRTQTLKKTRLEKTAKKRRRVSSSSDNSEYEDESDSYDSSDEDMNVDEEVVKSNKTSIKRLLPSNKLSVVVHNEGMD